MLFRSVGVGVREGVAVVGLHAALCGMQGSQRPARVNPDVAAFENAAVAGRAAGLIQTFQQRITFA